MSPPDLAIGSVTVHRVVDMDPFRLPLSFILPQADADSLEEHRALLSQGHVDFATGDVLLAVQSHVVRIGGKTILVDTCVGEMKPRPRRAEWHSRQDSHYLANLAAAGCRPDQIDYVLCTHLHVDHVGWNTRLENGRWVPTFPNARYIVSGKELQHTQSEVARDPQVNHGSYSDSVLPILEAGLIETVAAGDSIQTGTELVALPGHTPGQTGLRVATGDGASLVICGDAIHTPVQVLHPQWSSAFCCDGGDAALTRTKLLEESCDCGTLLVPGHLRGAGMRARRRQGGFLPIACGADGRAIG
jgi:glyoxylase-like metal-dependent hydrolase (beta-lactamase superfamily II)